MMTEEQYDNLNEEEQDVINQKREHLRKKVLKALMEKEP